MEQMPFKTHGFAEAKQKRQRQWEDYSNSLEDRKPFAVEAVIVIALLAWSIAIIILKLLYFPLWLLIKKPKKLFT